MKKFEYKNWFSIVYEYPLEEWKLARKFFKHPKLKLSFYKNRMSLYKEYEEEKKALIYFRCWSLSWKSKYDMLEYEHNPYMKLMLFNRWCIQLDFLAPGNDSAKCEPVCYWEGILSFMNHRYYNKDYGYKIKEEDEAECLYKSYIENVWTDVNNKTEEYTIKPYLTNLGWHTLQSKIQSYKTIA